MQEHKVPKYVIIEEDIIDKINNGTYKPGENLPTEAELSNIYNCSRVTVRQALSNLAFKGFITKSQGSGSYVKKEQAMYKSPEIKSFSEEMLESGRKPKSTIYSFNVTDAGTTISDLLKISPKDKIYYFERTRYADDDPVLFEKTFMSVDLHPEISIKVLSGSKYQYAKDHNMNIEYSSQNISPIFPPEYIANELRISNKTPILRIANTTYLDDGRVFDYSELYMHPELYQLNITKRSPKKG